MTKHVQDFINNMLKNNIFTTFFSVVGLPSVLFFLKDKYNHRKKIAVEAEEVYNVNSLNGSPELVNDSMKQYSNLIYNKVTVKSLNKEVVSSIILTKIKKEPNDLVDIRYDGGLYVDKQKFLLIAYNNGNKKGETGELKITVSAIEKGTRNKDILESYIIDSSFLEPGEVIGQYKIDLLKYKDRFENTENYDSLEIQFEDSKRSIPKYISFYDRNSGRFTVQLGAIGGSQIQEVPFFNLSNSKEEEVRNCSQPVDGISDIYFSIFVDDNCLLSYTVILKSNCKKIKSKFRHTIRIRIPKYKQEKTCSFGKFYYLINKYNPDLLDFKYSLDTIRDLQSDLVFDKYEAAKKYAKVTFSD